MKKNFSNYFPWFLAGVLAVFSLGANSSAFGEREVMATITKLNGDVLVLQRQMRDLQESVDKSQAQASLMLQKLTENTENSTRVLQALDDQVKTSNTAQINNLSGTTTRLNQIIERLSTNDQKFTQLNNNITSQINALRETIESNARRYDEDRAREKQERQEREKQPDTPPSINSPDQLYGFAFQHYSAGRYEQAITNFRRYIEAYGQTEAADNAQFMVAESFYGLSRLQEALAEYDKCLTMYPRGDKSASALFKKGLLLLQLERRDEGVNALRNVVATFPNAPESVQATQELNRLGEPVQLSPAKPPGRTRTGRP